MFKICYDSEAGNEYLRQVKSENCKIKICYNEPYTDICNRVVSCTYEENGEICGFGLGTVYERESIHRADQWTFGENRKRQLYIDNLWSTKNVGRKILTILEKELLIYVVALSESNGFYSSCGYYEIETPETEEDDDYVTSYQDGGELKCWMAKPLGSELDQENLYLFDIDYEWYFSDSISRSRLDMLNSMLKFELLNRKCISDLANIRDALIEKENVSNIIIYEDTQWKKFIKALLQYIADPENSREILKYFKIERNLALSNLRNYFIDF